MGKKKRQPKEVNNRFRLGIDENGLGAQLGPMLVTAVLAETTPAGEASLSRKLPTAVRADLDDSKALVKFGKHALAEAWARALAPDAKTPASLLKALSLRTPQALKRRCPSGAKNQCWSRGGESFAAPSEMVARVQGHLKLLERRGIVVKLARSEILCAAQLNEEREAGGNRFISDLHAMERLVLAIRGELPADLIATCGKVGGIGKYEQYFGPLSGKLRTVLKEERRHAAYYFPKLGELHFVQDADATDPLVMIASLVGKYLRELTMARISRYYTSRVEGLEPVSGYHDPKSSKFVRLSLPHRQKAEIPDTCFLRTSNAS